MPTPLQSGAMELHLPVGTLVNTMAVLIGAGAGLLLRRGFPERFRTILLQATGLFTLALGAQMALKTDNPLLLVGSLFGGALIGEALGLEAWLQRLATRIGRGRLTAEGAADAKEAKGATPREGSFSEGLITAFLIFCVGPMTIVGALDEGLRGDASLLLAKSLLDLSTSFVLAGSLGIGVLFSALPLLVFQLAITLLGVLAAQALTDQVVLALTATGGVLILGLGINLLGLAKLRIANLLPALLLAGVLAALFG